MPKDEQQSATTCAAGHLRVLNPIDPETETLDPKPPNFEP